MKRAPLSRKQRDNISGILFVALPTFGLFLFVGVPLIFSLFYSFTKQNPNSTNLLDTTFVGVENFARVLSDKNFYMTIGLSFAYALGTSLFQTIFALLLAFFLSKKLKGNTLIRVLLFIPYVCSVVAISFIWQNLLDKNFGLLNLMLNSMKLPSFDWKRNTSTIIVFMVLMSVWSGLGYGTILYSASLSNVDNSYYEAADVLGANGWQKFWRITFPSISPTTFFLLVMGMIGNLQAFANFQIMVGEDTVLTMVHYIWFYGFKSDAASYGMTYASAAGWLVGAIIIVFTILMFKLQKYWVHYES